MMVDLTGATVRMAVRKPSGLTTIQDCTITDAVGGKCEITLNNQSYIERGTYLGELVIEKVDLMVTSQQFEYQSLDSILADDTIESINDWTILEEILISRDLKPIVGDGTPNGIVTPQYIGQRYLDNTSSLMYFASTVSNDGWILIGGGGGEGGTTTIIDNLTSTSGTSALSANQGRILDEVKSNKPTSVTAAPVTTPDYSGQIAVDATNKRTYIAEGTTSGDWKRLAETTYVDTADNYITATVLNNLKLWKGTQAAYDGLTKDANTLYFITG